MIKILTYVFISTLLLIGCKTYQVQNFDYPRNIDTASKEIVEQEKKTYSFPDLGVYADNQFDGARLIDLISTNDSSFTARITPENEPINSSPWFAFKLWSNTSKSIYMTLDYG